MIDFRAYLRWSKRARTFQFLKICAHIMLCGIALSGFSLPAQAQSDTQIKKQIIAESLASYPGSCPCPYNTDRAGRSCGRRSAYSKPGGYSPICYPDDVTPQMISAYRAQNTSDVQILNNDAE